MHLNSNNRKLSAVELLVVFVVSIILSWKLFRLVSPSAFFWDVHNYLILIVGIFSLALSIKDNLYLGKSRTPPLVVLFICLSIIRLGYFQTIDAFTLNCLVFCSYFLIIRLLMRTSRDTVFKYFEALIIMMLAYNILDFVDANSEFINVFSYDVPSFMEGRMNPMGHASQPIWSDSMVKGVVIRSIGVAGTNYASSALTAATALYFFVLNRRFLFIVSMILLILWAVGSALAATVIGILLTKIRSIWSIFYAIFAVCCVLLMIQARGWDPSHLFNIINNFGAFDLLAAAFIGEGRAVSSMHSEFRIIGLMFSLGILGSTLVLCMVYNYFKYGQYDKLFGNDNRIKAGFSFISVLVISTAHYNTLFVFPNIFLFVLLIAISSAGFMEIRDSLQDIKKTTVSPL